VAIREPIQMASSKMNRRIRWGIFLAPFHPVTENATALFDYDLRLIELLDQLGFDEAWIGEHHSGGVEIIASPELFIAAAAERTKFIKLGTGVVSLPYHSPMMVAERMTQLDHMTRGRVMLGVGSGVLVSDAMMFGLNKADQRRRMQESVDTIMRLLRGETVTAETDWFVLRNARLQLPPFSDPHLEVVISASRTPVSAQLAGTWGLGILSISASSESSLKGLSESWTLAEQVAMRNGQSLDRGRLRICSIMHIAETRDQAFADVKFGIDEWCRYLAEAGGLAIVPSGVADPAQYLVESGLAVIGTPDDAIRHVERIYRACDFGTHLVFANDWADWQQTRRSYELIARYVIPHFNNGVASRQAAYDFSFKNRDAHMTAHDEDLRNTNGKRGPRHNVLKFARKIDRVIRGPDGWFRPK
jgi:limonene 1,2-monooxygenase